MTENILNNSVREVSINTEQEKPKISTGGAHDPLEESSDRKDDREHSQQQRQRSSRNTEQKKPKISTGGAHDPLEESSDRKDDREHSQQQRQRSSINTEQEKPMMSTGGAHDPLKESSDRKDDREHSQQQRQRSSRNTVQKKPKMSTGGAHDPLKESSDRKDDREHSQQQRQRSSRNIEQKKPKMSTGGAHDPLKESSDRKDDREHSQQQRQRRGAHDPLKESSDRKDDREHSQQQRQRSSRNIEQKNPKMSTGGAHDPLKESSDRKDDREHSQQQRQRSGRNTEQKKSKKLSTGGARRCRQPTRDVKAKEGKINSQKNQSKRKSTDDAPKKGKTVCPKPSTAKPCRLVIKPPSTRSFNQDTMTRYLQKWLGDRDKFQFYPEDTKTADSGRCQFIFTFQSNNQGRKAEQLLKKHIENAGEEIEVSILKAEDALVTTETLLANCKMELQEKITVVRAQHTEKINKINNLLERHRVHKHIPLVHFEKISSEREALKHKKDELELQQDEFQLFETQLTSRLDAQRHQPLPSVKNTIKELRKAVGRECTRLNAALPMYAKKRKIIGLVKENQVCVVLGETGSGKSSQMTQYLYEAGFAEKGLIVCTQPRKVAATSLAAYVAREMGGVPGQIVGCHVGGNIQASKTTGIVYATDHVLLNECLKDPILSKYSCIIIDEAHERSLYSDLLLGMIKKSLAERPELRVVITSATIDPALFVAYFDQCQVLKVSGRMFPVDVVWKDGPSSNVENYLQEAVNTVREIHHEQGPGDILVFLTSPVETERACEKLEKADPNLVCLPLHGKLRQEEQRRVFEEDPSKRKVVFATNCAETSITIPE
ncbi:hypothetical protein OS493_014231 [Desmophyllum pertusum]|uniref:Helicase ATP-binding domain-containing protein n=1 Tax=Desmophyllum pertusum TaxID=174260 RepID=A0A9W9Z2E2_9CNID|nr:hypothetical protein OS493_014231 [Desmophyllum pertusum]